MGGIENFLSWLLKDKITIYCRTHINQYFTKKFKLYDTMQLLSKCKIFSE